jgi:hypothetical protein
MKDLDAKLQDVLKDAKVAWHDGGRMFAGDETDYQLGWYVFVDGIGAYPVSIDMRGAPDDEFDLDFEESYESE